MQRRITGILCVWIAALALWTSSQSGQWITSDKGAGGLTEVASCVEGNCASALYTRFDEIAAWLNPLNERLAPNEGERLFVMLGALTHSTTQITAIALVLTGLLGLIGFGIQGSLSAPRISLLLLSSVLMFGLAFISTVPLDNVLGRLLPNSNPGNGYSMNFFGVLMGAFGAALVWQPIRKTGEATPNQRVPREFLHSGH